MTRSRESNFITTMREFVATSAIGASTLRNQGKGAIRAVREILTTLDLTSLKFLSRDEYQKWLDEVTTRILAQWPAPGRPWGAARKSANIFMRDALYNQYLNMEYHVSHVEKWMEVALDSAVARGLRNKYPQLPPWLGLKHLTRETSDEYQGRAQELADRDGINRVHVDMSLWLANR
jgi:hypothetical protein